MSAAEEAAAAKAEVEVEASPEFTARAALQQYHTNVRANMLGRAIVESTNLAAAAVEELAQSHAHTVEQLNAQVADLQQQLLEAATLIEMLGGRIAGDANAPSPSAVRQSFTLDVCTASREGGSGQQHTEVEGSRLTVVQDEQRQPDDEEEQKHKQRHPSTVEEAASDAFATAHSGSRCTGQTLLAEGEVAHSALFAEALQDRGTLKLQQQQQAMMVTQIKELTALLAKVVKENSTYRQELQLLRATTVPVEEHRQLLAERDALEQEYGSVKVELLRLEDELQSALGAAPLQQQSRQEVLKAPDLALLHEGATALQQASAPSQQEEPESLPIDVTHASTATEGMFHPARSHIDDSTTHTASGFGDEDLQHVGLWKTAIRELEQQATLAASQLSAAEHLREAEGRIEELQTLNDELRASLTQLETEDECVRQDCQQLTFRNGVLSQQVASLLVRVERQRRALERREQQPQWREAEQDEESVSDTEVLLEGEEPSQPRGGCRVPRGRVASAAQALLEHRSSVSARTPAAATATTADGLSDLLDVSLRPSGPLEIEGGVRTGLGVFACPVRRSLQLRNMGSPPVEAELTRVPRLPAADQLSGVALGRPSYYATLNPARPTVVDRSGVKESDSGSSRNGGRKGLLGSATTTWIVSEDAEENRRFLELLREDENLDRYSINSVAELLQRNQELLQQLYAATQRADLAAERLYRLEGSRATSDTEAAQPQFRVCRKRRREEWTESDGQQPQEGQSSSGSAGYASRESALNDGNVYSRTSASLSKKQEQAVEEEEEGEMAEQEEEAGHGGLLLPVAANDERYAQLETHVDEHINAVLRKHEAQLTLTDNRLAASLLRIMELARSSGSNEEEAVASTMKDAVITSLVRVCTEQGVRAASQAIALAAAQESGQAEMMRECWTEAQGVLLRTA
ncbi:hypothetical protein DQ04_05731050, partial [Trypanosoma grayi]|uniref:hypothetical protein n=1 Tax=Trypanosoma grayi TaxID=71804 RepID=UPI0004F49AB2